MTLATDVRWLALVLLVGCGRLSFDALGGSGADDASATGDAPLGSDAPSAIDGAVTGGDGGTNPDLLVWLSFEENPADIIVNLGSLPTAVTCVTTCPVQVPGTTGNGVSFNGTSDAIRIADHPALRRASGTIAAYVWVRSLPATSSYQVFLGRAFGMTGANTWELFFHNDGNGTTINSGGDASSPSYVIAPWTTVGGWRHVAATWSPTTQQLFLDGTLVGSASSFTAAYDDRDIIVGADEQQLGQFDFFFDGILDDVRIYNRVLTQLEVTMLVTI